MPTGRVLDRAARLIRHALDAAARDGLVPTGIAAAVPGTIDQEHGLLLIAPNLAWRDVHVVAELRERLMPLAIPVLVDNEANLAALGELWLGADAAVRGAAAWIVQGVLAAPDSVAV